MKQTDPHQSREPQNVTKDIWYYEDGRKLHFHVQIGAFEQSKIVPGVINFKVPLAMLEKSLARSPKKGKRK